MRIGIIGAGFIGRAVARLAVKHGHEVMISNSRHPKTLGSAMVSIGLRHRHGQGRRGVRRSGAAGCPLLGHPGHRPRAPLAGKILMDADNYYPMRDGAIPELDSGATTTSEITAPPLRRGAGGEGLERDP